MGKPMESAANGIRVMKWSSKRQDNAARVRNNQRRHRENARNYVKDLEAKLAESQSKLQEALRMIEKLRGEVYSEQHPSSNMVEAGKCPAGSQGSFTRGDIIHSGSGEKETQHLQISHNPGDELQCPTTKTGDNPVLSGALAAPSYHAYNETLEDEVNYSMRPSGEEDCTTLCREAYMIISQQNYAGIEEPVIYKWLEPGFRRASAKQAGCRVDNQTLFRLLDYISSSKYT